MVNASDLVFRTGPCRDGYTHICGPQTSMLRWLSFGRLCLGTEHHRWEGSAGENEVALVILEGQCTVEVEGHGQPLVQFPRIGWRRDVFSGRMTTVYIPRRATYRVMAERPVDIAVFSAPAQTDQSARLITPDQVTHASVGVGNWRRDVYTAIGENFPCDRFLIGETVNPPGNWSSFPPHKHDVARPPDEAVLEEVYFYRMKPANGFALQRLYTGATSPGEPYDVAVTLRDGDAVILPKGYHPVVAAPGYQVYYLWCLVGEERAYGAWADDPEHAWLRRVEPILREEQQ